MNTERIVRAPEAPSPSSEAGETDASGSLSPARADEAAVRLEGLVEREAQVFVDRLVEERAGDLLSRMAGRLSQKTHIKIVKRAIHRLRSLGHPVPEPERQALARIPVLGAIEEESLNGGFLSLPTPEGDWTFAVFWHEPLGDYLFLHGLLNDERGLLLLEASELRRKDARKVRQAIVRDAGTPMAEVAVGVSARAILDAVRVNDAQALALPPDFGAVRPRLEEMAGTAQGTAAAEVVAPILSSSARELAARSGELHRMSAFRAWHADWETLERCKIRLEEVLTSALILNDAQREEQIAAVFDREASAYVEKVGRGPLAARIRTAADVLRKRGEGEAADIALAVASELEQGEMPPFVLDMARKAFRFAGPKGETAEAPGGEGTRLVLLPQEVLRDRPRHSGPSGVPPRS